MDRETGRLSSVRLAWCGTIREALFAFPVRQQRVWKRKAGAVLLQAVERTGVFLPLLQMGSSLPYGEE